MKFSQKIVLALGLAAVSCSALALDWQALDRHADRRTFISKPFKEGEVGLVTWRLEVMAPGGKDDAYMRRVEFNCRDESYRLISQYVFRGTNIIDVAVQNANWQAVNASDVEMGLAYEKVCRPDNTRLFRNQSYNEVIAYTQTALRVTSQKQ